MPWCRRPAARCPRCCSDPGMRADVTAVDEPLAAVPPQQHPRTRDHRRLGPRAARPEAAAVQPQVRRSSVRRQSVRDDRSVLDGAGAAPAGTADYQVWDKAATIEFVAPAREHVFAGFQLDDHAVARLRSEAASGGDKVLYWFETEVATASGEVVVRVRKQLCVRPKPRSRPSRPRSATLSEGRRGRGDWHFSCMQIAGGVRPGIDRSGGMAARVAGRAWNAVHGQRTVSAK